jgi:multiple sugar transport system substrate-binding protein
LLVLTVISCGAPPSANTPAAQPTSSTAQLQLTGKTPGERAVEGLKALNLPADTTFTVFSEDLTIKMADVNIDAFKQETGLTLRTETAPFLEHRTKIMQDAINKSGTYDLVILQTSWMGDLYNAGYLTPLTEWTSKYDPDLDDMIAPFSQVWSRYAGEVYGLPTDGDTWILYYRKDLFEDPKEQEAYKATYGAELAPPKTWDEFNQIAEFFTRPEQNLYGATEWRVKGVTYWWFFQRLASLGGTYFKEGMQPAINGPEGVQALEDLKAMNGHMSPDVLSWGYVETLKAFTEGQAAMLITWPAAGKNMVDAEQSKVVGKVGFTTVPGYLVAGQPNPKTMTVPGYSLVVNSNTKHTKEAAYLVAQWLVSPEQLKRANMNLSGNTDVLRESIFADPQMRDIFPGAAEYLDAQKANIAQGFPEPIIPGYDEYMQALEIEISRFMTGELDSAQEALDNAAAGWEQITDKYGRDKQAELYTSFMDSYQQQ